MEKPLTASLFNFIILFFWKNENQNNLFQKYNTVCGIFWTVLEKKSAKKEIFYLLKSFTVCYTEYINVTDDCY